MADPINLLLRAEVPFEIWIVLVLCTGGIYLILVIYRSLSEAYASRRRDTLDPLDLWLVLREITEAVLSDHEDDRLRQVWTKYRVSEGQRSPLIAMVKVTLGEIFSSDGHGIDALEIKKSLVSRGVPEDIAVQVVNTNPHIE
jgi:hypothetical protein